MPRLFGTDGVRGVANVDLTPELALKLGRAAARVLGKRGRCRVVVGRDTRLSGDMLEGALVAGLCAAGAEVLTLGVVPTAAVAHLVRIYEADMGAMISASHNPIEDNGIKFFTSSGFKLPDEVEDAIEAELDGGGPKVSGGDLRPVRDVAASARELYVQDLLRHKRQTYAGLVVVDAAHGAATSVIEPLLSGLGVAHRVMCSEPDGGRINVDCGATAPKALTEHVLRSGADLGLAFDGDADRLIAVDADGQVVDGDRLLYVLARYLKAIGALPGSSVVATVMSNLGLKEALARQDIGIVQCPVGDRYVLEAMQKNNLRLGGEQSGHIVMLDLATTGDGLLSAVMLMNALAFFAAGLGALVREVKPAPQVLHNVRVARKDAWQEDPAISDAIAWAERRLGEDGRILVRPSGTEPLIRVMVEGRPEPLVHEVATHVATVVASSLGEG